MTVKEFGDRVQFRLKSRPDIDEFSAFHKKYESWIRVDGQLTLRVPVEDEPHDITFSVNAGRVRYQGGPIEVVKSAAATLEEGELPVWLAAATTQLAHGASLDGTLEGFKQHKPSEGDFIVFTSDSLPAIAAAARMQILDKPLKRLTIRTPLVSKSFVGSGAAVIPLQGASDQVESVEPGHVIVPCTGSKEFDGMLAGIQLDNLFAGKARHGLPRWDCQCQTAHALAEWVLAAPLRLSVARTLLDGSSPVTDAAVANLLARAKQDEDDLLHDRLTELRQARELFRSEALDLLGDLQKLRAEVGTLMGTDLFHNLVAIAIAISGLEIAQAPKDVTMAVALGVGMLFLAAGIIKAEVNRREFSRVVKFAQKVTALPAAAAVPDFRDWFLDFHNKAVTEFHTLYLGGTLAAALPAITVASYWAWTHAVWGAPWAMAAVLGITSAVYTIAFFVWAPWKTLKIQVGGATTTV